MGTRLIKEDKLYVDDTPMEKMREERADRIESAARFNSVETNLKLWEDMNAGNEKGLQCAARFRVDMQNDNGALRDPVAFRCNLTPHHRTGTKYKLYPTYYCAGPFVDALEVGGTSTAGPFPFSTAAGMDLFIVPIFTLSRSTPNKPQRQT